MSNITLYHDGCNLCLSIESAFRELTAFNNSFESVNLGIDQRRSEEAKGLGVKRLPSLVVDGRVLRIDDHSSIDNYLPSAPSST